MSPHTLYLEALVPTAHDTRLALASSEVLAPLLSAGGAPAAHVQLTAIGMQAAEIDLPCLLSVSRPSLVKMLDTGKLPYRKVGAHRRVRSEGALRYIQNERARRALFLEGLVAETERLSSYE